MSLLTQSMVEQFFEVEKENARGVLRKEMDSCMDTIFKQMKRKLMHLMESGRGGDETGHGLANLGDPLDREQQLYEISNDTNQIISRTQLNELNGSNQLYQGGLNDLVYYGQQLYQSSNSIPSTSNNQSHIPDNATSKQFQDDEITVKNELGEMVNIISKESIPTNSTQSQLSNVQSNDDIDDLFDELDEGEEDCDCPDCVGDLSVKMEEGDDDQEADDDDDDVQLIEDSEEYNDSNPNPSKRHRIEIQVQASGQSNQDHIIPISLNCPQCSQTFPDDVKLSAHMKQQHSIEKYRCYYKDCNRSFESKHNLSQHFSTTHPNTTKWPCGECSGQFKSHTILYEHHKKVHQSGVFPCAQPSCQFVATFKNILINHYNNEHKQFGCSLCAKRFRDPIFAKAHELTHRNLKPYRCRWPDCDFGGSIYQHNAIKHIRKHLLGDQYNSANPKDYLEMLQDFL